MNYLVFGFFLGILFDVIIQPSHRFWYDRDVHNLERGDKVRLVKEYPVYRGCDMIYIAGQAVSNRNEVWVLLKNCESESPVMQGILTDVFDLNDIERVIK